MSKCGGKKAVKRPTQAVSKRIKEQESQEKSSLKKNQTIRKSKKSHKEPNLKRYITFSCLGGMGINIVDTNRKEMKLENMLNIVGKGYRMSYC